MPAVEVSHIVKSYTDKVVVNDLSFSVNQGEIFGLIGPNGAGDIPSVIGSYSRDESRHR